MRSLIGLRGRLLSTVVCALLTSLPAQGEDADEALKRHVRERIWRGASCEGEMHSGRRYAIGLQFRFSQVPKDTLARVVIQVLEEEKQRVRTPADEDDTDTESGKIIWWSLAALVELDEPSATQYALRLARDSGGSVNQRGQVLSSAAGSGRTEFLPLARSILREAVDGSGLTSAAFNVVAGLGDEDDMTLLGEFAARVPNFASLVEAARQDFRTRAVRTRKTPPDGDQKSTPGPDRPPTVPPNQDPAFAQDPSVGRSVSRPDGSSAAEGPRASARSASSQRGEEGVSSSIRTFAGLGLLVVVVVVLIRLWKRR